MKKTVESVVSEVRFALQERNKWARYIGIPAGLLATLVGFIIFHFEVDHTASLLTQHKFYNSLALMAFSGVSVFDFFDRALRGHVHLLSRIKALGLAIGLEWAAATTSILPLACVILAALMAINAIAMTVSLARLHWDTVGSDLTEQSGDTLSLSAYSPPAPARPTLPESPTVHREVQDSQNPKGSRRRSKRRKGEEASAETAPTLPGLALEPAPVAA